MLEGVKYDMNWCKLYSAAAPVEGCEGERDAYLEQQEMMQDFLKNQEQDE
jgi:hypothetical protein